MRVLSYGFVLIALLWTATGCDTFEFDSIQPVDSVNANLAITDLNSAQIARAGIYDALQLGAAFDGYLASWQYFSDEADWSGTFPSREQFDIFSVDPSNATLAGFFTDYYFTINTANTFIDALGRVTGDEALTDEVRASLEGEARFARALMYFYITQGWVDAPLVLTPTLDANDPALNVSASPQSDIYAQIEDDLNFAAANLIDGNTLGMTSNAANALLARVQLYQGNWQEAYNTATKVLGDEFDLTAFPYLQDQLFTIDYNGADGNSFAFFYGPAALNGRYSIHPSDTLIGTYEDGDLRFEQSIGFLSGAPYSLKYDDFSTAAGSQTDPVLIIRHAEVALIAAEAAAELGNFDDAEMWLNMVRMRAGLDDVELDDDNFEEAILKERFVELSLEGGHRLWDLRRRGLALDAFEDLGYDDCDDRWPFPQREIDRNPNLQQNSACAG